MPATRRQRRVAVHFVLLPDSLILDWAGPAEALRIANQVLLGQGQEAVFELHFVGPSASTRSSVGACISQIETLPELGTSQAPETDACDWVVLVGQPGRRVDLAHAEGRAVLHWLRSLRLQAGRLELLCVCAGAVIAAHAGLLARHRATTHHQHLEELREVEPHCEVVQNRVFVLDPPLSSSAGVTTGIDLMLHRIAGECGPAVTAQVAQTLVVALRRGPQDPELSPFLNHRNHLHPALHRVQDAVCAAPAEDWDSARLAAVAHVTPRHLGRLFREHTGLSPRAWVEQVRAALAGQALTQGHDARLARELAGFASTRQMRQALVRHGGAPA